MTICLEKCPLCASEKTGFYHQDKHRDYRHCSVCQLVFVPKQQLPSQAEEKALYDQHENNPNDIHYQQFLDRLLTPLLADMPINATGLDFGCGPGPTISVMAATRGYTVENYDPIYAPTLKWEQKRYGFISATEVIEHIHWPLTTLDKLWGGLIPAGKLGIMTKRTDSPEKFATWHYKNDPTHVRFYAENTFQWLAERFKAQLEIIGPDTVILTKNDPS